MSISVLVPARNEEKYIGSCLQSIQAAARPFPDEVEIIVCLNRCTDKTESIARSFGARIVRDDSKNLSRIRNTAARAATGDILVTIDADSVMTRNLLMEVDSLLQRDDVIGGGTHIQPERLSLGIAVTGMCLLGGIGTYYRVSCGCFWCRRSDYDAIGGFDENRVCAEDIDFAVRLKRYGRQRGMRYLTLVRAYIRTSCRKFDQFGDWYFFRKLPSAIGMLRGRDRASADELWYDVER